MSWKKIAILLVLGGFSGSSSAQENPSLTELKQLVALQKARIKSLQTRLSRLVGPNGEILANGRMVVNSDGKWVGTLDGLQGLTGDAGLPGPRGRDGTPGADGRDGANGINGAAGQQGVDGPTGLRGPRGLPGRVGDPGPRGICGTI